MIPARVALALQTDGWWLRSDIIWHKPNPFPESVRDRPTKSYEHIFLLTKSARYWYDADAIKEPISQSSVKRISQSSFHTQTGGPKDYGKTKVNTNRSARGTLENFAANTAGLRNKRDVWTVATQPFTGAHFAVFPPKLIEPCILAGCPKDGIVLDPFAGSGTTAMVAQKFGRKSISIELNEDYLQMQVDRLLDKANG